MLNIYALIIDYKNYKIITTVLFVQNVYNT